jgi:hypothetical protein
MYSLSDEFCFFIEVWLFTDLSMLNDQNNGQAFGTSSPAVGKGNQGKVWHIWAHALLSLQLHLFVHDHGLLRTLLPVQTGILTVTWKNQVFTTMVWR